MKLYELAEAYRLVEWIAESDTAKDINVTQDDINRALDDILDNTEDKIGNIAKVILNNNAEMDAIDKEIVRLQNRRQSVANRTSWLKDYALAAMRGLGIKKIVRDVLTISEVVNPPSVIIKDISLVPSEYTRIIPEHAEADKALIARHFKDTGEVVAGAEINFGHHLSIR